MSDFDCHFLASMASNKTKTHYSTDEVREAVSDSEFVVSDFEEFGYLSSSEEKIIDAGSVIYRLNQLMRSMFQ